MELACAIMTLKGVIMTIKSKSKVYGMQRKEQNGAGMRNNDPKN